MSSLIVFYSGAYLSIFVQTHHIVSWFGKDRAEQELLERIQKAKKRITNEVPNFPGKWDATEEQRHNCKLIFES